MDDWNKILKEYLRNRPLFLSVLRAKEVSLYQKYLPITHPVLDFGCGDGFFAKVAFREKVDIGLDVEESRINEAKMQGVYRKIVIYDGKKIPFKNNYFATVVSNSVLEHVECLSDAVYEINRVLKPGGKFLTTVMTKKWEDYLLGAKIFGRIYKDYMRKKQVHVNLLTQKEWDEKFKEAGFAIRKIVGHLDKDTCQLLDLLHYISVPSLISYKLTGKWIILPFLADVIYPRKLFIKLSRGNVSPDVSGALFYELEKK